MGAEERSIAENTFMRTPISPTLILWAPRVLGVAFSLFVSLFAMDALKEGRSIWGVIASFTTHLVPTFIVLVLLFLAWRREWVGALGFISLSVLYLFLAWGRFHWSAYLAISGPLLLIGMMFLVSWVYRTKSLSSYR